MTNEEKQEIVNEVLAALHTHGKTIDQLTPVTSPSDSDTFELSGGRNLSYGTLKELITAIFTAALTGYVPADSLWEYIQQYIAKLDSNGALDWQESPVVMLATMGTTFDNVDGELPEYTLQEGDMYYRNQSGYHIHKKLSNGSEGKPAKEGVIYVNMRTMRLYKWTGSTMVCIARTGAHVVNDLTTGGEGDALSAEMGKTIRQNVSLLLSRLGEYAFPNGKPTLDWGGGTPVVIKHSVTKTIGTGLSSTSVADEVEDGSSLELTISVSDNLYVVDDDSVQVTMGGSPVAGAWNANTMKVTIAAVMGDVVINVPSMTYVSSGLVSMFDGMNVDAANNQWVDLKDNTRILKFSGNPTIASDHVEFDGVDDSALVDDTNIGVNVLSTEGTIEAVTKDFAPSSSVMTPSVFVNKNQINGSVYDRLICLGFWYSTQYFSNIGVFFTYSTQSSDSPSAGQPKPWVGNITSVATACVSVSNARGYLNGNALSRLSSNTGAALASSAYSKMGIASRVKSDGSETQKFAGKVYSVRIYSRQLTEQEALRNYAIDQKRFNIS